MPRRCLVLCREKDQMGVMEGRERKRAVPIPAGDQQAEEAYPVWVYRRTLGWGGQADQHMVIKFKYVTVRKTQRRRNE